jgi:ABC-type bacteriocin/lantibiotic exporter with double-glycine peptidase domain
MLWNGTPYSQFNQSLAHSFALVSQEVELFNLSLRENLTLGRQTSDIEITALLSKLDLRDLLEALPEGLDTLVGEKGLRLSAGQKQRINIARALLLKRQVLLLDEPTSHLDHGSEDRVIECLSQIDPSITLIIVSHRPALRSLCTRTYEFREGTLYAI